MFEHGDKCGRMLVYLSRDVQRPLVINEIMTSAGVLVHSQRDVLKCFVEYYRHLYSLHTVAMYQEAKDSLHNNPAYAFS